MWDKIVDKRTAYIYWLAHIVFNVHQSYGLLREIGEDIALDRGWVKKDELPRLRQFLDHFFAVHQAKSRGEPIEYETII